jgi:hypothetical protein
MADWRQIQARIRKAKLSADPVTGLTRIYERTHDGMAAFELATVLEAAARNEEALNWYTRAWQRFRRADWKQKSAEAIARLGGPPPQELPGSEPQTAAQQANERQYDHADGSPAGAEFAGDGASRNGGDEETAGAEDAAEAEGAAEESAAAPAGEAGVGAAAGAEPRESIKKRSRRGRRGGRRHRRKREREAQMKAQTAPAGAAGSTDAPAAESGATGIPSEAAAPAREREEQRGRGGDRERGRERGRDRGRERERREAEPQESLPFDGVRVGSEFAAQARAVDPGLASRMARLESKLRRLMASPAVTMDEIDQAPAGPGVFVLSDEDHTTYYYVENCRTLRIAIANIARARTMEGSLKEKFAEHLGISESNVGKYVKEHCVVRWLQMDEDASRLAHFAIAVLGPVLNE